LRENAALAPNVGPEFDLGRHFLANPGDDRAPAIASDSAGTSLVVWRDTLAAPAFGTYIFATRVAPDGTVIDANPIFISEGSTDSGGRS
jgi:hypothetical protein